MGYVVFAYQYIPGISRYRSLLRQGNLFIILVWVVRIFCSDDIRWGSTTGERCEVLNISEPHKLDWTSWWMLGILQDPLWKLYSESWVQTPGCRGCFHESMYSGFLLGVQTASGFSVGDDSPGVHTARCDGTLRRVRPASSLLGFLGLNLSPSTNTFTEDHYIQPLSTVQLPADSK